MTKVAILPEPAELGRMTYRAISGLQQSIGQTAGQALDALTASLPDSATSTMVIVQHQRPDEFFGVHQQARLKELTLRWRAARDGGAAFAPAEKSELDSLVEAETRAAGQRAAALLKELEQ